MDPTAPLFVWVLSVSALTIIGLMVVVVAAFDWHRRQTFRQAREWGRHLLKAQEAERGLIARDLHDDIVQRLWSIRFMTQAGRTDEADAAVEGVIGDLRRLSHELHPPALPLLQLGEALTGMAERHFANGTPAFEADIPSGTPLDGATALALYRVAQEAFTNIAKHAEAKHVWLTLAMLPGEVCLQIEDDGIGFDEAKTRHSFGLRGMRERMEMLGGRVSITSSTGQGTTVCATVPTP